MQYRHTDLCVNQLSQGTNELRCCIQVVCEEGIIDELTDGIPEGGFEALRKRDQSASAITADSIVC